MKKIVSLAAALLFVMTAAAQNPLREVKELHVYGVDYSLAKVNAADESDREFADIFVKINELLLREPQKYDFGKAFRLPVASVDISPVLRSIGARDYAAMRVDPLVPASVERVHALIRQYELPQTEGTGVVLVGLLLDKAAAKATYDVVFFDIATREILFTGDMTCSAGGFGLRNYWARTVYETLKGWQRRYPSKKR